MNRTAAEVEADVEASRSELDRNVEALKMKMTPGQMFDEAARMMGGTGQQVASKFAEQAKANPMPLAVMGLGLAWLMVSQNKQPSYGSYAGETRSFAPGSEYGAVWQDGASDSASHSGLKDKVHDLGEKASDAVASMKEKLAGGAHSMGDGGRAAGQHIGAAADAARMRAAQMGHQAQRTFLDTLQSEPLLIAGLGLFVGAAVGAALPSTSVEDRVMGDKRDDLVNRGKEAVHGGLQQANSVAQSAYGAVKSELASSEGDDRDVGQKLEDAVRSGVQAVRDEAPGAAH